MLAKLKNTTPAIGACGTDHNIGPGPVILLLSQENDMFEKVVLAIFWHGHCSQLKIKRPSWRYLQTERFRQVMEPNLFAYLGDLLLQCQWKVNRTNHIKQMLEVDLLLCGDLYWEIWWGHCTIGHVYRIGCAKSPEKQSIGCIQSILHSNICAWLNHIPLRRS